MSFGLPFGRSWGGKAAARTAVMLSLVVVFVGSAEAQLYRWTDAEGVTRYTNDPASIPPAFRARAHDIGSPQGRPPLPPAPRPPAVDPTVIPFAAGGPIRAAASLNGAPLTLMLDTGAERTVISPAALSRAGIASLGRAVQILGVTGGAAAREVTVERLDLAGTRLGPLAIIVHDVGLGDVDGLLGRDVLDYFTLTIDAAAGRAVLAPR